jgi:hypothetical protein
MLICIQAYHVHIRSISHHQKMMELERLKAGPAPSRSETSAPSSVTQSTVNMSAGLVKTSDDGRPKAESDQSSTGTGVDVVRGPNYCHVCCFDFANAEVGLV